MLYVKETANGCLDYPKGLASLMLDVLKKWVHTIDLASIQPIRTKEMIVMSIDGKNACRARDDDLGFHHF